MADNNKYEEDKLITETGDSYKDRVAVIDKKGKRVWVYPTKPTMGKYQKWRLIVGWVILALFFIIPFIQINGQPYFLIDIVNRKFIFFGTIWFPHDFYIFAIGLLSFALFVVLFTAILGRIFCGWACPQTIFMELVFRKIEYFIEGNANKQKALDKATASAEKIFKKIAKHGVFIIVSLTVNFFVFAYFTGIDKMAEMVFLRPGDHYGPILGFMLISLAYYINYSWFREQACTFICPYGRLQSVLLDENSLIVAYDNTRGEPRGKLENGQIKEGNGDCINCGACVRVCPTGIDIRNGLQLECVNCTNCIDSCDEIMDKINRPRGLVKYTSINSLEKKEKFKFTPRLAFYVVVLTGLLSVFAIMIATRSDVEANILRARGSTYIVNENGNVTNIFTYKLLNKTFFDYNLEMRTMDHTGEFKHIGKDSLILKPEEVLEGTFLLEIPASELTGMRNDIEIGLFSNGRLIDVVETSFSAPINLKK
jgi:cytochrome c oxidase accessory protein FixG